MKIISVTPENAREHTFFCIRNTREPGFEAKQNWFKKRYAEGLRLKVIYADPDSNQEGKQIGFIEYTPAEYAWRPVEAPGWLFVHCIMVYPNKYRNSGVASLLIKEAIKAAKSQGKNGVCAMTSEGPWIASEKLFEKNGFNMVDKRGRFVLMALGMNNEEPNPALLDWEAKLGDYTGWHLSYADQCPWHAKGVRAIVETAREKGIRLTVKKIESAEEARQMPSGFGVFALVKDGKLLEDHYISKRRFETIIERELN